MATITAVARCVGSVNQGSKEKMAYGFEFSTYGTPTSPFQILWDGTTDITVTNMEAGVLSPVGTVVKSTRSHDLVPGKQYKLEVLATITETGNIEGMYLIINAE